MVPASHTSLCYSTPTTSQAEVRNFFFERLFRLSSDPFYAGVMGKCKFNDAWRDKQAFCHWLKPVDKNVFAAFCTVCKKIIQLGTMGLKALESHAKSSKHISSIKGKYQTPSIAGVFSASIGQPAVVPESEAEADNQPTASTSSDTAAPPVTTTRVDLRTSFGSTPTMKAEVLWTLNTISKQQSYNGNDSISELFKCMFPDSDIATTFTCGPDKTAYIAKFGLAVYIKEELVSQVNKSPFVLMFDESLNETTKNKQLDVHVRFWNEGQVQSRYLGSQFMGHSTAQDLLSHLKVSMTLFTLLSLTMFVYVFMYLADAFVQSKYRIFRTVRRTGV